MQSGLRLSVVVPCTDRPTTLPRAVAALRASLVPGDELLVVDRPAGIGPAAARNAGAAAATRDVLVFVDADVVVHADALARVRAAFEADAGITAIFGCYDDEPAHRSTVSSFRNLLHHHVHRSSAGVASTFWAGLGAVRRAAFEAAGGFDTARYPHASVEDIDFGMRLTESGARIELRPEVQGKHLKRWTLASTVHTDFARRGIPWTVMLLERRRAPRTLNIGFGARASALAALALTLGGLLRSPTLAAPSAATVAILNGRLYRLFARRMGVARAPLAIALHQVHQLVAVSAFAAGLAVHGRRELSAYRRR